LTGQRTISKDAGVDKVENVDPKKQKLKPPVPGVKCWRSGIEKQFPERTEM